MGIQLPIMESGHWFEMPQCLLLTQSGHSRPSILLSAFATQPPRHQLLEKPLAPFALHLFVHGVKIRHSISEGKLEWD